MLALLLITGQLCAQVKGDVADYGDWRPIYHGLVRESGLDTATYPLSVVRRQTGFTPEVRASLQYPPVPQNMCSIPGLYPPLGAIEPHWLCSKLVLGSGVSRQGWDFASLSLQLFCMRTLPHGRHCIS